MIANKSISPFQDIARLLNIYHQTDRVYDSSVRAVVVEVLLNNKPTEDLVRNLFLAAVGDQDQFELSTFVLRKILDMMNYDKNLL